MSEYIDVETPDGRFTCYLARPTRVPAPAIVVVQELFGVNKDLRATCEELAAQGYVAASPDLFWRMQPGIEMNLLDDAEWKRAFELYAAFDLDAGVGDISATMDQVSRRPECDGKVGLMGYCLGGLMTYLTTARKGTIASVAYYPGGADKHLAPDAREAIVDAFRDNPLAQVWTYPNQCHAFARHGGKHFDKPSADLANGRTAEFFRKHLQQAGS
jgi:carboxymethylenebutenolidase